VTLKTLRSWRICLACSALPISTFLPSHHQVGAEAGRLLGGEVGEDHQYLGHERPISRSRSQISRKATD
jgi:hypothetical protein